MPYGYLGTQPNQTVKNTGVLSVTDVAELQSQGKLGGSLELIQEQSHSSDVAIVDFTSIKENVYDVHLLQFNSLSTDGTSSNIRLQFYESGVLETASVYQFARQIGETSGSFSENRSTAAAEIEISNYKGSIRTGSGYIYLYNLGNSSKYSFCTFQTFGGHSTDQIFFGGGVLPQASAVNGIRILGGAGTVDMTDFTFKLYGVKQI